MINMVPVLTISQANVIPAYASAKFYTRAVTREQLAEFKPRIENCFKAAALATGCTHKLTWAPWGEIDGKFDELLQRKLMFGVQMSLQMILWLKFILNTKKKKVKSFTLALLKKPLSVEVLISETLLTLFLVSTLGKQHILFHNQPITYVLIILSFDIGTRAANHTKDFTGAAITEEAHIRTLRASRSLAKAAADVLVDDEMYKKVVANFEKGKAQGFY